MLYSISHHVVTMVSVSQSVMLYRISHHVVIMVSGEEEKLLQNQIFDLIKTIQHINLTEGEIALFSATLLVRPGELLRGFIMCPVLTLFLVIKNDNKYYS